MHDEIKQQFLELLQQTAQETKRDFAFDLEDVASYASQQATLLAEAFDEPGYEEAFFAARDNVALRAGISSVKSSDGVDARLVGIFQAGLKLGVALLVAAI